MSSTESNIDVLVVGAGPVGLVAALVLAQNGVSIRIVDKLDSFDNIGQRGAGLQPRSLEVYNFLGVLDDFIKKGSFGALNIRLYDTEGKQTTEVPFRVVETATPEIPFPSGLTLGQDINCAILRQHLKALGVEVETATELVTYEQDEGGVTATLKAYGKEEKIAAKFLLGTDGARGGTRRTAGIQFVGETAEIRAVIGDVELSGFEGPGDNTANAQVMHQFVDEHKNKVLLRPIPEDSKASFILAFAETFDLSRFKEDKEYMQEQLRLITRRPELIVSKIRTAAEWRLNERVADHLKIGRVVLAGDAAHCHSPSGAQGLNSGVLDAMNVAWKLASVVKGQSPLSLLDTYEEERLPVIREMLRLTNDMADKSIKRLDKSKTVWKLPSTLRQLGVHCRWSGIVRDEFQEGEEVGTGTVVEPENVYGSDTPERLHAGDRAPNAPGLVKKAGETTQLFKLFKATHHTIIVFEAALVKDVLALTDTYPKGSVRVITVLAKERALEDAEAYTDSQGHAHRAYGTEAGVKIAIVRPDGVVGGLLKGPTGIGEYFTKIFA